MTTYLQLGVCEKWSILASLRWSVDSCQTWESADQYHMTLSRAQVSSLRVFLKSSADKFLVFSWSQAQDKYNKNKVYCRKVQETT